MYTNPMCILAQDFFAVNHIFRFFGHFKEKSFLAAIVCLKYTGIYGMFIQVIIEKCGIVWPMLNPAAETAIGGI